jgi:hypothetical protein
MGCFDITCQSCALEHVDGTETCILFPLKIIWVRPGASKISIPTQLPATYGGYGDFTPLDDALAAKVAFCDADTATCRDVEDILETCGVPDADYLVSVVAASKTCWEAEEEEEEEEEEEPPAAVNPVQRAEEAAAPPQLLARDADGRTPLHLACMNNNPNLEVIKFLFELAPSAAEIADNDGKLPLGYLQPDTRIAFAAAVLAAGAGA